MRDFLHHLFVPRDSNNHRARILHHTGLLILITALFFIHAVFSVVHTTRSDILGIQTSIAVEELLTLTNQKRSEAGLPPLSTSPLLTQAASQKASDMFAKNYWAHNSPDGTTPWVFIKGAGYDYLYAGENLARGFTTSSDVVDAWMASQGHRDNMLSENYTHIGFAIVPGTLTGDETILVVEMFGTPRSTDLAFETTSTSTEAPAATVQEASVTVEEGLVPEEITTGQQPVAVAALQANPLVDVTSTSKGIGIVVVLLIILAIVLDAILIERKKIYRIVSHNIDTVIFLIIIGATLLLLGRGMIL